MLNLKGLSKVNASRCIRWHGPAGLMDWSPERWMTAIAGEWGEVAGQLSIHPPSHRGPTFYTDLADELADTIIYTELMTQRISFDLSTELLLLDCYESTATDNRYFILATKYLGEAANALKKVFRVQDEIANVSEVGRQIDTVQDGFLKIGKDLASFVSYVDCLGDYHGLDVQEAIKKKFNETSNKYGFPERLA